MNAVAMRSAQLVHVGAQPSENQNEAHDRSDDAHGRGESAGGLEETASSIMRGSMMEQVALQHLDEDLRLGAVDDQAQALAQRLVLEVFHRVLEAEDAVPARLFGELQELLGELGRRTRDPLHRLADQPRDAQDVLEAGGDGEGADGSRDDDDQPGIPIRAKTCRRRG